MARHHPSRSAQTRGHVLVAVGLAAMLALPVGTPALELEANAADGSVAKSSRGMKVTLKGPQTAAPGGVVKLKGSVKRSGKPLGNARVKIQVLPAATPTPSNVASEQASRQSPTRWTRLGRSKPTTKANGKFRTRVKIPEAARSLRLRAVVVKPSRSRVISSRKIRIRVVSEVPGVPPTTPSPPRKPAAQAPDPVPTTSPPEELVPDPVPTTSPPEERVPDPVPTTSPPEELVPDPESPGTPAEPTEPEGKRTVLLIPGYGGVAVQLEAPSRWLAQRDVESEVIYIGDGLGDLREYAEIVETRAEEIIASGAPAPDLIGYSAGGLTARTAFSNQPQSFRKIVTLASPHQGTWAAVFAGLLGDCPIGCQQMQPGSDLLESFPEPQRPADWLSVWSQDDEAILPAITVAESTTAIGVWTFLVAQSPVTLPEMRVAASTTTVGG
jgi:pimeloyl-ACP methyl ester carboxylesterase